MKGTDDGFFLKYPKYTFKQLTKRGKLKDSKCVNFKVE